MLKALLIYAVFASNLPPPTVQNCMKVKKPQCLNLDFAPGSNLAGEGFDITTMERKGVFVIDMSSWLQNNTCTVCKNPYAKGKMQKLPVSVVDWRPSKKCHVKVSSSVYQSSESLVSSSVSSIENNWKLNLNIEIPKVQGSLTLAGSQSKLAEYSSEKTKNDKFSFTSHKVSCGYYRYRVISYPPLQPELKDEFDRLPVTYDSHTKHLYYKLIDTFGTHYITKVNLGGQIYSVTSIKECQVSMQGLSVEEVKTCLDVEASVSVGHSQSQDTEARHCKKAKDKDLNKKSFSSSFSDRETYVIGGHTENVDLLFSSNTDPKAYKEWVASLPTNPDVLTYSLEPLHELMSPKKGRKKHLRKAIKDYILQRALLKNCSSPCKTGVKTNSKEPCSCSCHNNPGVALNCCPTQKGLAQITVTVIKATDLYGDYSSQTDGYVKIYRNGKAYLGQTSIIWNNNWPTWNCNFNYGTEDLTMFSSVKLEVWDRDSGWDDDLLGACTVKLKSGVEENFCSLNHGALYYKVQVKCIPGLAGSTCMEYKPSPMDAQLKKVYISRNARPIPTDMLLEMGVLLDERIPRFNLSNVRKAKGFEL